MFCHCGSYRLPGHDGWQCRQGCGQPVTDLGFTYITTTPQEEQPPRYSPDEMIPLPAIAVTCPECGNDEAYAELKQLRAGDEPETQILHCTACKHIWRKDG
ncbi:transcription factor S [Haloterrigena sp. SYSU A121-1]|uniref:Transcription factor S n=2 Tax=Haloterrigena gelatinilytica TaxID=2741724 RepID=A0A8J8KFL1_9EURY|nr:transcription factor S [Haloterrigena gelatinilytica]